MSTFLKTEDSARYLFIMVEILENKESFMGGTSCRHNVQVVIKDIKLGVCKTQKFVVSTTKSRS